MFLFRVYAHADWKGRPTQILKFLSSVASIDEAIAEMNADVRSIMIDDLLEDRELVLEENGVDSVLIESSRLVLFLELSVKSDSEVKELWSRVNKRHPRWEMDSSGSGRSLVYNSGDFSSFGYHLLDHNHEPVSNW